MYPTIAVANHFIVKAREDGVRDLSSRKLQDLLYCAHGWALGITRQPLLDEDILAAEDGPYIAVVADAAGGYGTKHIGEELHAVQTLEEEGSTELRQEVPRLPAGSAVERVLGITWKAFGSMSAFELSRIVKTAGGPWEQIWNRPQRQGRDPTPIEMARIQRWFSELAERNRRQTKAPTVLDTQRIDLDGADTKKLRLV